MKTFPPPFILRLIAITPHAQPQPELDWAKRIDAKVSPGSENGEVKMVRLIKK